MFYGFLSLCNNFPELLVLSCFSLHLLVYHILSMYRPYLFFPDASPAHRKPPVTRRADGFSLGLASPPSKSPAWEVLPVATLPPAQPSRSAAVIKHSPRQGEHQNWGCTDLVLQIHETIKHNNNLRVRKISHFTTIKWSSSRRTPFLS